VGGEGQRQREKLAPALSRALGDQGDLKLTSVFSGAGFLGVGCRDIPQRATASCLRDSIYIGLQSPWIAFLGNDFLLFLRFLLD